jgi:hypothetical protein
VLGIEEVDGGRRRGAANASVPAPRARALRAGASRTLLGALDGAVDVVT